MNLEFAFESRVTVKSFSLIVFVKTRNWIRKTVWNLKEKIKKNCLLGSRSQDNVELGCFTLILQMTAERNAVRIMPCMRHACVLSHCTAHQFFWLATFPFALTWWFFETSYDHNMQLLFPFKYFQKTTTNPKHSEMFYVVNPCAVKSNVL